MKYDKALQEGKLLKKTFFELAVTPVKLNNGKNAITMNVGNMGADFYGLGWFIFEDTSMGKIAWHTGGMPGCRTMFMRNLDRHQLVIVLENAYTDGLYKNALNAMYILNNKTTIPPLMPVAKNYARLLLQHGNEYAFAKLIEMKMDTLHYKLDENEFNDVGYAFFENGDTALSLTTFRNAVMLFPRSDNLCNSYGEILAKSGKKDEAIIMYKASLLLNPQNEDSKKSLENLEK